MKRRRATIAFVAAITALVAFSGRADDNTVPRWWIDQHSEFGRAAATAKRYFGHSTSSAIVLRGPPQAVARQGQRMVRRLRSDERFRVVSPWSSKAAATALRRRGVTLIVVDMVTPFGEVQRAIGPLRRIAATAKPPVSQDLAGAALAGEAAGRRSIEASHAGERLALPVLLLVLLMVMRSPIAAAIPLLLGLVTVQAGRGVVGILGGFLSIDPLVLSLTSTMGLALGVDYGLLMVARFREELGHSPVAEAAAVTRKTAGSTVKFAAVTLLLGLVALIALAQNPAVRSFALGAVIATTIAATLSVLVVPPLLGRIGQRIDLWRVGRTDRRSSPWMGLLQTVIKRPLLVAAPVLMVLLAMSAMASGLTIGAPEARQLPSDTTERRGYETVSANFGPGWANPFEVVAVPPRGMPAAESLRVVRRWQQSLRRLRGTVSVVGVSADLSSSLASCRRARGCRDGVGAPPRPAQAAGVRRFVSSRRGRLAYRMLVIPPGAPSEPGARRHYDRLHEAAAELRRTTGIRATVAGPAAWLIHIGQDGSSRLTVIIAALAGLTLFALTVLLRAPLVALLAVALNLLTVGACFGVLAALAPTGLIGDGEFIEVTGLSVIFTVIFGLSIDYEVFLLTRVQERWQTSGDTGEAASFAVARTAGVLTGAAVILGAVFLVMATSDVAPLRQVGVGLAVAIALDATVVRLLLLPALLSLIGDRLWWSPQWMQRPPPIGLET